MDASKAARSSSRDRETFARKLLERTADPRNVRLAIEHVIRYGGPAVGKDGVQLTDLNNWDRWELARVISDSFTDLSYSTGPERTKEIPKTSGQGTRPITIQSQIDRAAERAVLQAVQPFVDPMLTDACMGYRAPGYSREATLAVAFTRMRRESRYIMLAEDIKDAFGSLPLQRLWDALRSMLGDTPIVRLIRRMAGRPQRRGIRQGGSLSSLLLNAYLHRTLDQWWLERHPEAPLIRVADDLLLQFADSTGIMDAVSDLRNRLRGCGLATKGYLPTDLRSGQAVEWLGYRISLAGDLAVCRVAERAWSSLRDGLWLTLDEPDSILLARNSVLQWLAQLGPISAMEMDMAVTPRLMEMVSALGLCESLDRQDVWEWHHQAERRWRWTWRDTYVRVCRGLAAGSAQQHRVAPATQSTMPITLRREVLLYTDGSVLRRSRAGGWAFLFVDALTEMRWYWGSDSHPRTTNNRMELTAVLRGLSTLNEPTRVRIVTDSRYVFDGIKEWIPLWREGDRRALKRRRNRRLWERVARLVFHHDVTCEWTRSHQGRVENEFVDQMARHAALNQLVTSPTGV